MLLLFFISPIYSISSCAEEGQRRSNRRDGRKTERISIPNVLSSFQYTISSSAILFRLCSQLRGHFTTFKHSSFVNVACLNFGMRSQPAFSALERKLFQAVEMHCHAWVN
jgi:hypothetical protein